MNTEELPARIEDGALDDIALSEISIEANADDHIECYEPILADTSIFSDQDFRPRSPIIHHSVSLKISIAILWVITLLFVIFNYFLCRSVRYYDERNLPDVYLPIFETYILEKPEPVTETRYSTILGKVLGGVVIFE